MKLHKNVKYHHRSPFVNQTELSAFLCAATYSVINAIDIDKANQSPIIAVDHLTDNSLTENDDPNTFATSDYEFYSKFQHLRADPNQFFENLKEEVPSKLNPILKPHVSAVKDGVLVQWLKNGDARVILSWKSALTGGGLVFLYHSGLLSDEVLENLKRFFERKISASNNSKTPIFKEPQTDVQELHPQVLASPPFDDNSSFPMPMKKDRPFAPSIPLLFSEERNQLKARVDAAVDALEEMRRGVFGSSGMTDTVIAINSDADLAASCDQLLNERQIQQLEELERTLGLFVENEKSATAALQNSKDRNLKAALINDALQKRFSNREVSSDEFDKAYDEVQEQVMRNG